MSDWFMYLSKIAPINAETAIRGNISIQSWCDAVQTIQMLNPAHLGQEAIFCIIANTGFLGSLANIF